MSAPGPAPGDDLLGVVLAGGRSSRFGSDKAAAEVGGRPMLDRALDALRPCVVEVGVVLGAAAAVGAVPPLPPGTSVRRDGATGLGPLEGLRVALAWARDSGRAGVVALACDLPLVGPGEVAALVAAWRDRAPDAPDGVVPVVDGRPQPLAAVYSTGALPVVERRLRGEDRSLRGMLHDLRVDRVPAPSLGLDPARFLNVNTPADGDLARSIVSGETH